MNWSILILALMSLSEAPAVAQEALATTSDRAPSSVTLVTGNTADTSKRKITGSLTLDTSSTLAPGSTGSAGEGLSQSGLYRLNLGVPLPGDFEMSLLTGYSQEYSYVRSDGTSGGFIDTGLKLARSLGEISKNLKISPALNLALPTSRDSQKAGLYSGVGLSLDLTYKTGKWNFAFSPRYTSFYHSVVVQDDGTPNISNSIGAVAQVGYQLSEKWALSLLAWPSRGWSYAGVPHDSYLLAYEVDYQQNPHWGYDIGFLTNGSALKSNGIDYNYTVFDQGQTAGYFDVVYSL